MSKVSAKAEHLIRAAVKGIQKEPETWNQLWWVNSRASCGTTYCVGGWMLLYDGWSHGPGGTWLKGDRTITDPYDEYLQGLVYGDERSDFGTSIFHNSLRHLWDLMARIEDQLEINFEEECPCVFESELCDLAGCPCGTHREAAVSVEPVSDVPEDVIQAAAQLYVQIRRDEGKFTTVAALLDDKAAVLTLRAVFRAGAHSTVTEVTKKAQRRIAEINDKFQWVEKERDDLKVMLQRVESEHDDLEAMHECYVEPTAETWNWERDAVIRSLQARIDDLRAGTRRTPEFRKMKAALRDALEGREADRKVTEHVRHGNRLLERELAKQKGVVRQLQAGFSQNLTTSVAVIEDAIKKIKGEA